MSNTAEHTEFYVTKINGLVADGREDLIAAIIADYERGTDPGAGEGNVSRWQSLWSGDR